MKYFLVIDFETSGLPSENAQPIELGAVLLDKKSYDIVAEYHTYIKYDSKYAWSEVAEDIHGLNTEMLDEYGQTMPDALNDFLNFLASHINLDQRSEVMLCAHNAPFDLHFLRILAGARLDTCELPPWACVTVRDTLQWASLINEACISVNGYNSAPFRDEETGYPSVSLQTVYHAVTGKRLADAHSAILDARATAVIMRGMRDSLAQDINFSGKYQRRMSYKQKGADNA